MRGCPHQNIVYCPLYHAMHGGHEFAGSESCDDGRLDEGGCAVARGESYEMLVGQMKALAPGYVEQLEWKEDIEEAKQQRTRNMSGRGLH
ncbi:MAG: hypothetical protein A49_03580 [Methyloceanibacter sp.]|nr:MAG: hypothetical protein A49_03580 [Methyloceanibacter sp.]